MATHSSVLAWRIPGTGEPGWAAIYGVAQSQTRLKWLSSSSMYMKTALKLLCDKYTKVNITYVGIWTTAMIWSEQMMWEGFQCRETSTRECRVMMAEGRQMAIESSALDCRKHSVIWWAFEKYILCVSSVQSLSRVRLFATPWIAACNSLSITNSWSSLKLTSIELVMLSSHLILCCPLLLLPPIPPSIRVFSNESALQEQCKMTIPFVCQGFPCGSAGEESTAMRETWVRSLGWEYPWRRKRLPTPVFWPGEFHGLYSPRGREELDMTEWLSLSLLSAKLSTEEWAHRISALNCASVVEKIPWRRK